MRTCTGIALSCLLLLTPISSFASAQVEAGPEEAREIAKEAYIYGNPVVDNYRIQYAYFVDRKSPEFRAPWNQIYNMAQVFTPDDKAIQTADGQPLSESA